MGNRGLGSSHYSVAVETGSSVEVGTGSFVAVGTGSAAEQRWRSAVAKGLCCCSAGPDQGLAPEVTGPLACSDWIPAASVV